MFEIEQELKAKKLEVDEVYINIIPLMLMAGRKLVELSQEYIPEKLGSTEAKFFFEHFQNISNNQKIVTKYPYNKKDYANDIKWIIIISEEVSKFMLNGGINPYLEDIKYKGSLG